MTIFAKNDVEAKSKFFFYSGRLKNLKRANGEILACSKRYDTSPEVVEELQAQNYQFAGTVQRGGNATFTHPLLLRRTMIYGQDDLQTFKRRLTTFKKVDLR